VAAPLVAQDADPLARLDLGSRIAIETILDSARAASVPAAPLISKAYEGIAKHADGRRVVAEVAKLFRALRQARAALGPNITEAEWTAGASAIQAGVPTSMLEKFKPGRSGRRATPLVVLTDLITRGVPVDTASSAIVKLWQGGAGDAEFDGLRKGVEEDILSGATPGAALQQRARLIPANSPGTVPPAPSGKQPETPSL
jgi:hypothetical protein